MVEINDFLLDAVSPSIDSNAFFSFAPAKPMQAQQVAISSLHDMFLGIVSVYCAKIDEVGRVRYGSTDRCSPRSQLLSLS